MKMKKKNHNHFRGETNGFHVVKMQSQKCHFRLRCCVDDQRIALAMNTQWKKKILEPFSFVFFHTFGPHNISFVCSSLFFFRTSFLGIPSKTALKIHFTKWKKETSNRQRDGRDGIYHIRTIP